MKFIMSMCVLALSYTGNLFAQSDQTMDDAQSIENSSHVRNFLLAGGKALSLGDYDWIAQAGDRRDRQYLSEIKIKDRNGKSMLSAKLSLPQNQTVDVLGLLETEGNNLILSTSVAVKRSNTGENNPIEYCYFPVKLVLTPQSDNLFYVEDEVPSQTVSTDPFIDCPRDWQPVKRLHEHPYQKVLNLVAQEDVTIDGNTGGFTTDFHTSGKVRRLKVCLRTHNAYIAAYTTVTITDPTGKKHMKKVHFEGCGEFEMLNGVDLQGNWTFELAKEFTQRSVHNFKVTLMATPD